MNWSAEFVEEFSFKEVKPMYYRPFYVYFISRGIFGFCVLFFLFSCGGEGGVCVLGFFN